MQTSAKSLTWPEILAALRACTGESVLIRDGKVTEPAETVRSRPAAKGTELCLFPGKNAAKRTELIKQLETLADAAGRRFTKSARASIGTAFLLVEGVSDENVDGVLFAVVKTRRPTLGYNPGRQTGDTTTFRNKRIKRG